MSPNANNASVNPAVPSSEPEELLQDAGANTASDTPVTNIDIDYGVPSWSVAEYKMCHANSFVGRSTVWCDIFGRSKLIHVRPSDRLSELGYQRLKAEVDVLGKIAPRNIEGWVPV